MRNLQDKCRVAVVQAAPIMFDKGACIEKAIDLIRQAAKENAELIVFPNCSYPDIHTG